MRDPISYDEISMLDQYLPGAELNQCRLIKMTEGILKSECLSEAVVASDFVGTHVQKMEDPIFGEKACCFVY